jgi:SulP family sulfate permease
MSVGIAVGRGSAFPPRSTGIGSAIRDIAGGFGDAALLIPLAIALVTVNHLNGTAVFAGAGLLYIASGRYFRLPIPVQPLKAVSAIAISSRLGPSGIAAAGLLIGALFFLLWLTRFADLLRPVFTPAVVRGIQLSVGILLARAAWERLTTMHQFSFHLPGGIEGPLIGVFIALLVAVGARRRVAGIPWLLLGAGLLVGVIVGRHRVAALSLGPEPLHWVMPGGAVFLTALWSLAIPQLALSLGNSLMGTSSAATSYFGPRGAHVTPGRLAFSMGLANLLVSPLGGMPMCHGAAGLTAHVRMGAVSGTATTTYGVVLIALALTAGAVAPAILAILPVSILAGMLLYVGVMHATLIRELHTRAELTIALLIGLVSTITSNITVGVIVGLGVSAALAAARRGLPHTMKPRLARLW